jgi:hypothetical protein
VFSSAKNIQNCSLYACETWSLALREGHRLKIFENRVPWRMFGPRRVELVKKRRNLHNEELHNVYSVRNVIRMMSQGGRNWQGMQHEVWRREMHTGFLVGKLEEPRCRWECAIRISSGRN